MQIDRILFPITSLGPGNRLIIWTIGCDKKCKQCANPELRNPDSKKDVSLNQFKHILEAADLTKIEGFTITGGEPLKQSEELSIWMDYLNTVSDDILIFTGYSVEEINLLQDSAKECISKAAITISGEYVDELNDNVTPLIASSNQKIIWGKHYIKHRYMEYFEKGRTIQNIYYKNNLISVGIHNRRNEND